MYCFYHSYGMIISKFQIMDLSSKFSKILIFSPITLLGLTVALAFIDDGTARGGRHVRKKEQSKDFMH